MLPIGRTISVGGVLLAIMIVALALSPRGGAHSYFMRPQAPARGPLLDRYSHPEWRQLLIRAAFRRAEELQELQARSEPPVHPLPAPPKLPSKSQPQPPAQQLATLPDAHAAPPAATGATATIPVDIGEASSTELPVEPHEEKPPIITVPQIKPRQSGAAKPAPQPPQQKAMQEANLDKHALSTQTPQVQPVKPQARRPHRRARRHSRAVRRARRSAQAAKPAQFNLLQPFGSPLPYNGQRASLPDRNAAQY